MSHARSALNVPLVSMPSPEHIEGEPYFSDRGGCSSSCQRSSSAYPRLDDEMLKLAMSFVYQKDTKQITGKFQAFLRGTQLLQRHPPATWMTT